MSKIEKQAKCLNWYFKHFGEIRLLGICCKLERIAINFLECSKNVQKYKKKQQKKTLKKTAKIVKKMPKYH